MDREILFNSFVKLINDGEEFTNETLIKCVHLNNFKYSILEFVYPRLLESFVEEYINLELNKIKQGNFDNITSFTDRVTQVSIQFLRHCYINTNWMSKIAKFCIKRPIFGTKLIYTISSQIMKISLDRSLDFSFYTKRVVLFGIFISLLPDLLKKKSLLELETKLIKKIQSTRKIGNLKRKLIFNMKK